MENTKKYFIVPLEYKEEIDQFTTQQAGELFQNLMEYAATGTVRECSSFPIKLMFGILKRVIDQNFESYEEVKNKRRDAANKRWSKETENDTNECKVIQSNANECKAMQSNANDTNTKTITNTNTKTNTNNSSSAKLSERVLEDEFQEIWNIYPRKEGRKNALKAYIKARKNGTSQEEIKKGLDAYISKIKAEKTEPQYIKHGSSWFAQECWLDEYSLKNSFEATQTEQQQEEMQEYWQQFVIG